MQDAGHVDLPDQPELYGVADTRCGDAWAELLRRYPAHCFATLTFRPVKFYTERATGRVRTIERTGANGSMHGEAADKAFRFFVSNINREIYGPKWGTRWHRGIQWVRGSEFHKDGRLHFHALLSAPTGDLNHLVSRYAWHEWWYREFGRNQIEQPRSQHDVASYVSKYVVKDGSVDFSPNFGSWHPPKPDYSVRPQQSDLSGVAHDEPDTRGLMLASRRVGQSARTP